MCPDVWFLMGRTAVKGRMWLSWAGQGINRALMCKLQLCILTSTLKKLNQAVVFFFFSLQSPQSDPNMDIFWSVLLLFFPPKRKLQWQIMAKGISVGKSELHLGLGNFRFKPDLIH